MRGETLKDVIICTCLFSTAFLIRVAGIKNVCMYPDEWLYWQDINRILVSEFAPRADVFDYAPPFFPYVGAVFTLFFEGDLYSLRILSVVFGSLTVPFLYLFGKEIYGRKEGLLSALFLCFSSYHSLYSRIIMLEAFTLFFVTAFLFFFWRACSDKKSIYAIIAGAMMGLAFDAKYISFFLIPAVIVYILWTSKFNFKALLDKRIILMFFFAFIFFLPLLICLFYTGVGLHGLYFYSVGKFEKKGAQGRLAFLDINELLQRAFETVTGIFAWGSDKLVPIWEALFNLSVISLLLATIPFYLLLFAKRDKAGSFLIVSVFSLYLLLSGCPPYRHYQIYTLPFYFVMLSHFIITFKNYRTFSGIFTILIALIILSSYITTGLSSPYWDEGEYSGVKDVLEYIKKDMQGNNRHIIIGTTFREITMDYSIHLHNFNASAVRIIKPTEEYEKRKYELDMRKIDAIKPDYLVILEHKHIRYYLQGECEQNILRNYSLIYYFKRYFTYFFILRIFNASTERLSSIEGEGKVSKDIFKESVPSVMKVGKTYTALVKIKNTGNSSATYYVSLHAPKFVIFVDDAKEVTLDKNEEKLLKFNMVPMVECRSRIPIVLELYVMSGEAFMRKKVDYATDYVYFIGK